MLCMFEKLPERNETWCAHKSKTSYYFYKYIIILKEFLLNKVNGSIKTLCVRVTYLVAVTKYPIKAIY